MSRAHRLRAAAWLYASLTAACAYYSTSGGLIGGIRTLSVPLADNDTAEYGIGEQLSERMENEFARDGRLRVVDEERADAVLYLTVAQVDDAPFTYTAGEVTEQYRFRVRVAAELVRSGDGESLLDLPALEGWGTYDAALPDAEGREPAVQDALDMVIEEVLDRVGSSW